VRRASRGYCASAYCAFSSVSAIRFRWNSRRDSGVHFVANTLQAVRPARDDAFQQQQKHMTRVVRVGIGLQRAVDEAVVQREGAGAYCHDVVQREHEAEKGQGRRIVAVAGHHRHVEVNRAAIGIEPTRALDLLNLLQHR
jgi:hypothetical protein